MNFFGHIKKFFQSDFFLKIKRDILRLLENIGLFIIRSIVSIVRTVLSFARKTLGWSNDFISDNTVLRYGVAFIAFVLMASAPHFFPSLRENLGTFLFLLVGIALASWYGGFRPGLAAYIGSFVIAYIELKEGSLWIGKTGLYTLSTFLIEGALILIVTYSLHRALAKLDGRKQDLEFYTNIAHNIFDAVIAVDTNFLIESWNEGAEQLYGWTKEEAMGKHLYKLIPTDYHNIVRGNFKDELFSVGNWKGEVLQMRKNGKKITVLISMSVLRDEEDKPIGMVSVNRDIMDRKKLEQGKNDFIALASHELKTPLTSIKLFTQLLKQRFLKKKDRQSLAYLSNVDSQIDRLTELVKNLLDVSRLQGGKFDLHKEEIEIDKFVRDVVRDVQRITPTHKIVVEIEAQKNISGDKDRLRQVLVNLLMNAVKYSPNANKVLVRAETNRKEVIVRVEDYGIGISKEHQDKIFEQFYQVTDAKGYTYDGIGLGLYISSEIVRRHEGKLWVESEESKGSVFSFMLPVSQK